MVFIGMIFQFNSDQGTGLIMLSDGEKKEFSTDEWADEVNRGFDFMIEIFRNLEKCIIKDV